MDMNRLTQKSQEALHDAQTKAIRFGHTEVDGEHLLLALLDDSSGLIPRLLEQAGADPAAVQKEIEAISLPAYLFEKPCDLFVARNVTGKERHIFAEFADQVRDVFL